MKTSINAAAIHCATFGRNAVRFGKFGMGRLVLMSDLSLLQRPVYCSIAEGEPLAMSSSEQLIASRMPDFAVPSQKDWRSGGDSRKARKHITLNVMPVQKTLMRKASALA